MLVSCVAHYLTLKMGTICSSERCLIFTGLHSILSQKMELFYIALNGGIDEFERGLEGKVVD
jgi:hypothetical protein